MHDGEQYAGIFWDAKKFYDTLDVKLVWDKAHQLGMNPVVCLVVIINYMAPRRLRIGDNITSPTDTDVSIVAGCRFANTMARVATHFVLNKLHNDHQWVWHEQYVDGMRRPP